MADQPTNEECADMFRVLLGEAIRMHPHYLNLERQVLELVNAIERPGSKRTELLYFARVLKATVKGFR